MGGWFLGQGWVMGGGGGEGWGAWGGSGEIVSGVSPLSWSRSAGSLLVPDSGWWHSERRCPGLKQVRQTTGFVHVAAAWSGSRQLAHFFLFSSRFSFISLWYNSAENMPIVHSFGSGVAGTVIKTNRLPVSHLVSFPFLSRASSFLTVDRISQPSFLSAVSMTLSSTVIGTFPTHSFVAGFSLFWTCRVNGFLGSSDTCVPHKFMPPSRSLSLASCQRG